MREQGRAPNGWEKLQYALFAGVAIIVCIWALAIFSGCGSKDKATVEVFTEKSLEPIANVFKDKIKPILKEKEDKTRERIEDTEFWQILGTAVSSVLIAGLAVWNRSHAKKLAALPAKEV